MKSFLGSILCALVLVSLYVYWGSEADSKLVQPTAPATLPESEAVIQKDLEPVINQALPIVQQTKENQPSYQKVDLQSLSASVVSPEPYHELVTPNHYLNTNNLPITIAENIGKKIILVAFMTYSCINCQRTFPSLVDLDTEYRDDGLLVIGIHTPEFAFEHDAARVQTELAQYGITFPVVLDNEYKTWNAYGNRFWPRRYIIDSRGNIVYDHIGEGDYEGAKRVVEALLPTLSTI